MSRNVKTGVGDWIQCSKGFYGGLELGGKVDVLGFSGAMSVYFV